MGRRKYTNLSHHYEDSINIKHPSPAKLSIREKEILPKLKEVEEKGVWAPIPDLIQKSMQATINYLVEPEKLENVDLNHATGRK